MYGVRFNGGYMKINKHTVTCGIFAIFLAVASSLCLFLPKDTFSESERRQLAEVPSFTVENVLSGSFMKKFEEYTVDTFPFRDAFRSIKAVSQLGFFLRSDNNGIYIKDSHVSDSDYPMNPDKLSYAMGRLNYVYDKLLADKNCEVYFSVIPDKNYYLAETAGALHMNYDEFFSAVKEMFPVAHHIDISDLLETDSYYKTDTHWRQEKLIPVSDRILTSMGKDSESEYETRELDVPFYGVYHGQAALPLPADRIYYLTNDTIENAVAYDYEHMKEIPVYDMAKKDHFDPYEVFLSGPLSLVTIENSEADGGHLIMFRDSFGSSIAPLFIEEYEKITLIDIRYIRPDVLRSFVDFEGADVLFLYSSMVLNNGDTLK